MIPVQYPEPRFRIKKEGEQHLIFDEIRKRWVQLTEEEWVRQNFISYLVQKLDYPLSFIAVEKELTLHELRKRFDVLVYDNRHQPWMLIECKAPEVALSENTLQQVLRYGIRMPAPYVVITNGRGTMAWKKEEGALVLLQELPNWS